MPLRCPMLRLERKALTPPIDVGASYEPGLDRLFKQGSMASPPPVSVDHRRCGSYGSNRPVAAIRSSLSRSDGEVAARSADGGAIMRRRGPSTIRFADGSPPHRYATGRIWVSANDRKLPYLSSPSRT